MSKRSYTKWPDQNCADTSPFLVPPSEGQVKLPGNRRSMASEPTCVEVDVSAGGQGKPLLYTEDLPPLHANKVFGILDLTGIMIVHDLLFHCIGYGIAEHKCDEISGQDAFWKMTLGPYLMVDIPLMTWPCMNGVAGFHMFNFASGRVVRRPLDTRSVVKGERDTGS